MRATLVFLIMMALFYVSGCGTQTSNQATQQADNEARAKGNAAVQTASYATDCSSQDLNIPGVTLPGTKTVYDLSDLNFTKKLLYYTDKCQTQALVVQEKGTVNVIGPSGAVNNALEEDFNFKSTTITITNDTLVNAFNAAKVCGANDWQINVEKDVSAKAGQSLCPGQPSPRTAPELVLVENSNLYMGDNTNSDPSKGRPTTVDRSLVFKKQ